MRTFLRRIPTAFWLIVATMISAGPAAAQDLGGVTNMSRSPGHGTQVEYVAEGGKTYLWYPRNTNILKGQWKVEDGNMCFAYGANSYNPVTKQRGGWECEPVGAYQGGIAQQVSGDPMGLAGRRAVPFDLTGRAISLDQILAMVINPGPPAIGGDFSCEGVIANAERSKSDMSIAAGTYFSGMFMGKRCVDVDYARAFALAEKSGTGVDAYLKVLRERAAGGNPRAESALRRLGYELTAQ
ncbi:hypothetical protein ABIB57_001710 [Devosia sp. UYZn731]|uniref:hypothetical protein n=1 Tax=Devosia sp. UYZn731 TaxID=3156345 RepID=UPI003399B626